MSDSACFCDIFVVGVPSIDTIGVFSVVREHEGGISQFGENQNASATEIFVRFGSAVDLVGVISAFEALRFVPVALILWLAFSSLSSSSTIMGLDSCNFHVRVSKTHCKCLS